MLEGAKSAEPPMNSGSTLAMALRQSCHVQFRLTCETSAFVRTIPALAK